MEYRSDIDGLRTIAVVPVILFHAGFSFFSGGFVGVDVFFVISGYLITILLIEDMEKNCFSIVGFYERRARRILPALFVVILACIPFAWLWMTPSELKGFSKSLVAVSIFASNVLFWKESGYFDTANEEKPLLHTWSLAVEEQFYLFFPIFLIFAWRFGRKTVVGAIILLAVVSLFLSEWGWRNSPIANFYLASSRIWELFAGSIAAIIIHKYGIKRNQYLSFFGLVLIAYSVFMYSKQTPFPSVYTLVPVLGAVFVILFSEQNTLSYRLLSLKPMVFIGLLSYSAYLWHQPLMAFARLQVIGELPSLLVYLLIFSTFLLAYISYRFIETPFRKKEIMPTRQSLFAASIIILALPMTLGLLGYSYRAIDDLRDNLVVIQRSSQLKKTQTERQAEIRAGICHFNRRGRHADLKEFLESWSCYSDDEQLKDSGVLLVGDSHSADKAVAFRQIGIDVIQLAGAGCPIAPTFVLAGREYCIPILEKAHQMTSNGDIKAIFLVNRFPINELSQKYIKSAVEYWQDTNTEVIIWSPMPDFTVQMEEFLAGKLTQTPPSIARESKFFKLLEGITLPKNVKIVHTSNIWCPKSKTNPGCKFSDKSGNLLMTDGDHLSLKGASIFAQQAINDPIIGKYLR